MSGSSSGAGARSSGGGNAPGPKSAGGSPGGPGDAPSDLPDRKPDEPELRFPGYDVLDQQSHWDDRTREVVLGRLDPPRRTSFFTPDEEAVCRPLLDRLLANDAPSSKVPVFE
ncbi:MAG: hypothetical protein ACRDJU_10065, partial [Actinomycetota bacterium]